MESYRHPEAEHSHACESSRAFAPGYFWHVPRKGAWHRTAGLVVVGRSLCVKATRGAGSELDLQSGAGTYIYNAKDGHP